jgi:hypothetical protein
MTNGRPPAINSSTALGGRLPTSIRIRLSHQDKRFSASEADMIWTNNDLERLSDHRFTSIVGQISEEVTAVAAASPPHITPAIRVMSEFQCHLLNPEDAATQIKIFPPELRGAGEGSAMMDAAPAP